MKIFVIAAISFGFVSADFSGIKPKLSLTLKDGSYDNLQSAFAPRLSVDGSQGAFDYGASLDAPDDWTDILTSPKSIWAQGTSLDVMDSGWSLKGRAEYTEGKYDYPNGRGVYLTVEAKDEDSTFFGWFSGHACAEEKKPSALKIGSKKLFDLNDGSSSKIMVEPRYDFEDGLPDLCLGYERDETLRAYLTVSPEDQNIKVIQSVNDYNTLSAKVGRRSGFVSASLHNYSDLGRTKITITRDSADVELTTDDGWMAGFHLAERSTSEPLVRFRKTFDINPTIG